METPIYPCVDSSIQKSQYHHIQKHSKDDGSSVLTENFTQMQILWENSLNSTHGWFLFMIFTLSWSHATECKRVFMNHRIKAQCHWLNDIYESLILALNLKHEQLWQFECNVDFKQPSRFQWSSGSLWLGSFQIPKAFACRGRPSSSTWTS